MACSNIFYGGESDTALDLCIIYNNNIVMDTAIQWYLSFNRILLENPFRHHLLRLKVSWCKWFFRTFKRLETGQCLPSIPLWKNFYITWIATWKQMFRLTLARIDFLRKNVFNDLARFQIKIWYTLWYTLWYAIWYALWYTVRFCMARWHPLLDRAGAGI